MQMSTDTDVNWQSERTDEAIDWRDRLHEGFVLRIYEPAIIAWSDRRTQTGLLIVLVYLSMALVDLLGLWRDASTSQAPRMLGAFQNWSYPLGTTQSGVDVLALIIDSTPFILQMVLAGGVWATGVAVIAGTISGYKGGLTDSVITAISDFFMSIPGLPLVIVLGITLEPESPLVLGVILTINYWAGLGRSIRSQVLSIRNESYVEAARAMGTSTVRIIRKDILPNLMPYVLVNFVFAARYTIFAAVALYFLGVLPYTGQNWGITLNYAYNQGALFGLEAIHWLLAPIIAIVGLACGLILLSQGMDRIFNPRVRTRLTGESESVESTPDHTTEVR